MKVLFCLLLATWVLPQAHSQSLETPGSNPAVFELSTDMLRFDAPTAEFFLGWQRDVNSAFQAGLDALSGPLDLNRPDRGLERAGMLALFTGVSLVVNQGFSLTAHDQRHMDTARSIGSTGVGLVSNSGAPMSIWQFFVEAFNFTVEPGLYSYDPPAGLTPEQEAYVASEGLNTNLLIAANVARTIDEGAGHVTDLAPYLLNKVWGIRYFLDTGPTSDAQNYMALLQEQGGSTVTQRNVIALQTASWLVSGGFLSLARGAWQYIADGEARVRPLELGVGPARVFWPEVTTWLNAQNVSVQVTVDAAWGSDLFLRAGVDAPVLSAVAVNPEVTVAGAVKIQVVRLRLELTSSFSGFPFLLGSADVAVSPQFSVGLEGYYGKGNTMREAREHPLGPGATVFLKAAL